MPGLGLAGLRWLSCWRHSVEEVRVLDYAHCSLSDVPADVFSFERTLEELVLDSNRIKDLPRPLFLCQGLHTLRLQDNEVNAVPPAVSCLAQLQLLDLSRNALQDLPSELNACKRLAHVNISNNPLLRVPEGVTQLVALEELYLNDVELEFLPANFGRLSRLRVLELRDNRLTALPSALGRLQQLQRLDIGHNEFQVWPEVLGRLSALTELWCDLNELPALPAWVGNLRELRCLDASNNRIRAIAPEISSCARLTDLRLSYNELGRLPYTLGRLQRLQTLKLDHNLLDQLPETIGEAAALEELVASHNRLDLVTPCIGFLRRLQVLLLDDNRLCEVPGELGSCRALTVLGLRRNRLRALPPELGHLPRLRVLGLSGNQLRCLPVSVLNLGALQALWLSDSQSAPLVQLHGEYDPELRCRVLTCLLLPQDLLEAPSRDPVRDADYAGPGGNLVRRSACIRFSQDLGNVDDEPGTLLRAPTPYPKELRTLARQARRAARSHAVSAHVFVKEAASPAAGPGLGIPAANIKEARVSRPQDPGTLSRTNSVLQQEHGILDGVLHAVHALDSTAAWSQSLARCEDAGPKLRRQDLEPVRGSEPDGTSRHQGLTVRALESEGVSRHTGLSVRALESEGVSRSQGVLETESLSRHLSFTVHPPNPEGLCRHQSFTVYPLGLGPEGSSRHHGLTVLAPEPESLPRYQNLIPPQPNPECLTSHQNLTEGISRHQSFTVHAQPGDTSKHQNAFGEVRSCPQGDLTTPNNIASPFAPQFASDRVGAHNLGDEFSNSNFSRDCSPPDHNFSQEISPRDELDESARRYSRNLHIPSPNKSHLPQLAEEPVEPRTPETAYASNIYSGNQEQRHVETSCRLDARAETAGNTNVKHQNGAPQDPDKGSPARVPGEEVSRGVDVDCTGQDTRHCDGEYGSHVRQHSQDQYSRGQVDTTGICIYPPSQDTGRFAAAAQANRRLTDITSPFQAHGSSESNYTPSQLVQSVAESIYSSQADTRPGVQESVYSRGPAGNPRQKSENIYTTAPPINRRGESIYNTAHSLDAHRPAARPTLHVQRLQDNLCASGNSVEPPVHSNYSSAQTESIYGSSRQTHRQEIPQAQGSVYSSGSYPRQRSQLPAAGVHEHNKQVQAMLKRSGSGAGSASGSFSRLRHPLVVRASPAQCLDDAIGPDSVYSQHHQDVVMHF